MGAEACDRFRFPQSDLYMDEGENITIKLSLTNCGTGGQGNFFYKIKIDGSDCDTKYNEMLYPGENASETLKCDVVMGTSIIEIEQIGGHYNYDTGTWDEDFRYEHKLKPRACQTTCETACQTGCEVSCELTCELSCQSTCEVYCKSQCETGCQAGCLTACQVGCETYCEVTCQSTCEVTCQTGCETVCQVGCETICETGCEVSCQTAEEEPLPSLTLVPTLTSLTLDEELCPEVECESGIDDVCIYIDGVKTTNCATSGIKPNIRCKTLIYPNDFDEISGASLGIGTHTLQAKSPNASESNIVDIAVTEPELYIESCNPTEISNGTYGTGFTDLTFNATAKNNTSAHAYIFFRLTRKGGVSVLDEEPDSQALPPFYIGADDTQDVVLGVPSIQETFVTLKDEWIRVDLWQSNINWGDKKLVDSVEIKVGDPDAPPDDEESIWKIIADLLGLTVPQVKAIVMAGGGLLALSFIMPLFRR